MSTITKAFEPLNTHGEKVTFGKHKGTLYTRVPVDYLQWMCLTFSNETGARKKAYSMARSELMRRGSYEPHQVSVSMHAIDRASQRGLVKKWIDEVGDEREPGFATWITKCAEQAISDILPEKQDGAVVYRFMGRKWVFTDNEYPTLKTIK